MTTNKTFLISQETLQLALNVIAAAYYPNTPASNVVNVIDRLRTLPEYTKPNIAPPAGDTPNPVETSSEPPGSEKVA